MQNSFPGYNPSPGNLEYIQAEIISSFAADLAQLCANGAQELFRVYGTTLVGLPYQQGIAAIASISVTAQASSGTIATTSTLLSTGGNITAIPVNATQYGIQAGTITITDPTLAHTQTWTVAQTLAGTTSLQVTSQTPNFAYPVGSTITGTSAYDLPAFSQFNLDNLGFQTLTDNTVQASTSVTIQVAAVQTGIAFNGAGSGGIVQVIQQTPWITATTIVSAASGGVDPEDDTHYLNRLTTALQLQAPRPITATDYANMALSFTPQVGTDQQFVGRATAVDGYDVTAMTFNNEREVTLCVTDSQGNPLNNDTMYGIGGTAASIITAATTWGIAGWLGSLREIGFIINVIAPTYTSIYVTVSVKASPGWDSLSVQTSVQTALLFFLSPANWGLPPSTLTGWQNNLVIYPSVLSAVINNAPGVDHILSGTLKFGTAATPSNTTDLTLTGPVPLPVTSTTTIPLASITVS